MYTIFGALRTVIDLLGQFLAHAGNPPGERTAGLQAEVVHLLDDLGVLDGLLQGSLKLLGDGVRKAGGGGS